MDIRYNFTLWLYIAFGSNKYWLTQASVELTELNRKVEILMFRIGLCAVDVLWCWIVLIEIYFVKYMWVRTFRVEK